MSRSHDLRRQFLQLMRCGAVVRRGHEIFGGASHLEQAILEIGEFRRGQYYGVLGQPTALYRGASFVGTLAAGLAAVTPGAADPALVWQA